MLFNSLPYLLFLPIVFCCYWFVFAGSLTRQNAFLLAASYFFYAWWDWRFLFLLLLSTTIDYTFGLVIYHRTTKRKLFLVFSILNNLLVLGFFKYYNFFIDSAISLMHQANVPVHLSLLKIALPVGISFYTFHGMSYVFDIYFNRVKPTRNVVDYGLFVSFFPLLVAGPIERAHHLLPQIQTKRLFNYEQAVQGLRLILWGMFKKVVIADTIAVATNTTFGDYQNMNGSDLLLGAILFAVQIYCDFSGYTDIALGSAKLFGFELLTNFRFPYFSRDIAEFWRRWHISLSSWFRDYVYIPLGGSREGKGKAVRNTLVIFLLSGLWHGANWTFIFWGLLHALFFLPLILTDRNRRHTQEVVAATARFPTLRETLQMLRTFALVCLAWVFFRSPTLRDGLHYLKGIPHRLATVPQFTYLIPYVLVVLVADWFQRKNEREVLQISNMRLRYAVYFVLAMLIVLHFPFINKQEFIYFQF